TLQFSVIRRPTGGGGGRTHTTTTTVASGGSKKTTTTVKPTPRAKFIGPSNVTIASNTSQTIVFTFLNSYDGNLSNIKFSITGLPTEVYEIQAPGVMNLGPYEKVEVKVKIKPNKVNETKTYTAKLSAESEEGNFSTSFVLNLKTEETTSVTQKEVAQQSKEESQTVKTSPSPLSGFFVYVKDLGSKILLPLIAFVIVMTAILVGRKYGIRIRKTKEKENEYIEIRIVEKQPKEEEKELVEEVPKILLKKDTKVKEELIKEIRKRAMEEDKKLRRGRRRKR
ncbi:MAG: hypothetical protein J7K98_02885, partial [Candidatus Aenigmarchaeota archaeon]|nr:hypothetical protein [Candidatus Aenigmarchaeota archaeon]